eukprot:TRINITY_DN2643_c0_g1_i3.p1 TRINITY_DN2643_c0_g1~~TRINITY_DN2643_c0_g1_i3.p1  ORF type:complete len:245 (-),score=48.17 TRINITY_DN2643_c0_g1_i3:48-782(-)
MLSSLVGSEMCIRDRFKCLRESSQNRRGIKRTRSSSRATKSTQSNKANYSDDDDKDADYNDDTLQPPKKRVKITASKPPRSSSSSGRESKRSTKSSRKEKKELVHDSDSDTREGFSSSLVKQCRKALRYLKDELGPDRDDLEHTENKQEKVYKFKQYVLKIGKSVQNILDRNEVETEDQHQLTECMWHTAAKMFTAKTGSELNCLFNAIIAEKKKKKGKEIKESSQKRKKGKVRDKRTKRDTHR